MIYVPHVFNEGGEERCLLECVHPLRHQSGGEEDQEDARHAEKGAHVQPFAGGKHQPAQHHGDGQPQRAADQGLRGGRAEGGGGQKEHRLDPLPHDGHESQAEQTPRAAGGGRPAHVQLQFRLDMPALTLHPEDHPGEHPRGQEHRRPLENLLGAPFKGHAQGIECQTGGEADDDGHQHAGPHQTAAIGVPQFAQHTQHNTDDEGGLQPLP